MALPLRQHTATTVWIGPFLAATDGFTRQTALLLTGTGLFFQKLGGTFALGTSTATLGGGTGGWYSYSVATANVDTAGRLRVDYNATGSAISVPVWHEYVVEPQQVYDSLRSGTDNLQVDVLQWNGATVATATGTSPNVNITHIGGATLATDTAQLGVNVVQWRLNTMATATGTQPNVNLTHIGGATLSLTSAQIGANAAQVAGATPQTATDIAAAVWDKTASDHQTSGSFGQTIGTSGGNADTIYDLINTNLDAQISAIPASVMAEVVEGSTTVVQSMRLWNGILGGDSTGLDTGAPIYKSLGGGTNRWEGSANNGNRTVSNRDLTAT